MSKIGIDFGTTYTTLCYVNESRRSDDENYIEVFRAEDHGSVPSAMAYHKKKGVRNFGSAARGLIADDSYQVFQHFKMLLAMEGTSELDAYISNNPEYEPYKNKKPSDVTRDFLTDLLKAFKRDQNIERLETVVITIPLVWRALGQQLNGNTGSAQHKLLGALRAACQALELKGPPPKITIKSEPEAAAGYFAHEYKKRSKNKEPLTGKLLVVDYGGGTLDLTLAEVGWSKQNLIELSVLETSGRGKSLDFALGAAGVAYDKALLNTILNGRSLSAEDTSDHLNTLETKKRHDNVRNTLNEWVVQNYPEDEDQEQAFNVNRLKVLPKDCLAAYKAVNDPHLQAALDEVFSGFPDLAKSTDLKVVLAGGFSNLAFVEHAIRERMGIPLNVEDRTDPRLAHNRSQDRHFSIAMGAALVAAQLLHIDDSKTEYQIGFWAQAMLPNGQWGWKYFQIIDRHVPYKDLAQPRWARDMGGNTITLTGGGGGLILGFSDTGNTQYAPRRIPLDQTRLSGAESKLKKLVPGWENSQTRWSFGFSVQPDEEGISGEARVLIHFINLDNNRQQAYPINELMQLLEQVVISDESPSDPYVEAYRAYVASGSKAAR
ncbi:hypothetical protein SAMN04489707_102521 [Paenacidovorax caeni]|uniref:Molecular chaperone DnaK (HSP70) n=1 Tax=Paenacidovorax caeni TaxID=343013 RepID=A0A1I7JE67_9BURK|nr:hypothetical protein [Paenacidovorax caeni]SFU83453.1 hypothetical protein SAMN04489707_102521 [Paenacidovorax caeni]